MHCRHIIQSVETKVHVAFHIISRTCDNMRELFILSSLLSFCLSFSPSQLRDGARKSQVVSCCRFAQRLPAHWNVVWADCNDSVSKGRVSYLVNTFILRSEFDSKDGYVETKTINKELYTLLMISRPPWLIFSLPSSVLSRTELSVSVRCKYIFLYQRLRF